MAVSNCWQRPSKTVRLLEGGAGASLLFRPRYWLAVMIFIVDGGDVWDDRWALWLLLRGLACLLVVEHVNGGTHVPLHQRSLACL